MHKVLSNLLKSSADYIDGRAIWLTLIMMLVSACEFEKREDKFFIVPEEDTDCCCAAPIPNCEGEACTSYTQETEATCSFPRQGSCVAKTFCASSSNGPVSQELGQKQLSNFYYSEPSVSSLTTSYLISLVSPQAPSNSEGYLRRTPLLRADNITSCKAECKRGAENCMKLPGNFKINNIPLKNSLTSIKTTLEAETTTISKSSLMAAFDVHDDPCNRSDIANEGNSFSNKGELCTLSTAHNSSEPMAFKIALPKEVTSTKNISTNGILLKFKETDKAPTISFLDTDYEYDWGGKIKSVNIETKGTFVQTSKGCIWFDLESSEIARLYMNNFQ